MSLHEKLSWWHDHDSDIIFARIQEIQKMEESHTFNDGTEVFQDVSDNEELSR